jgi:hypothetical protein
VLLRSSPHQKTKQKSLNAAVIAMIAAAGLFVRYPTAKAGGLSLAPLFQCGALE